MQEKQYPRYFRIYYRGLGFPSSRIHLGGPSSPPAVSSTTNKRHSFIEFVIGSLTGERTSTSERAVSAPEDSPEMNTFVSPGALLRKSESHGILKLGQVRER